MVGGKAIETLAKAGIVVETAQRSATNLAATGEMTPESRQVKAQRNRKFYVEVSAQLRNRIPMSK